MQLLLYFTHTHIHTRTRASTQARTHAYAHTNTHTSIPTHTSAPTHHTATKKKSGCIPFITARTKHDRFASLISFQTQDFRFPDSERRLNYSPLLASIAAGEAGGPILAARLHSFSARGRGQLGGKSLSLLLLPQALAFQEAALSPKGAPGCY